MLHDCSSVNVHQHSIIPLDASRDSSGRSEGASRASAREGMVRTPISRSLWVRAIVDDEGGYNDEARVRVSLYREGGR